jgi:hypothetical protein
MEKLEVLADTTANRLAGPYTSGEVLARTPFGVLAFHFHDYDGVGGFYAHPALNEVDYNGRFREDRAADGLVVNGKQYGYLSVRLTVRDGVQLLERNYYDGLTEAAYKKVAAYFADPEVLAALFTPERLARAAVQEAAQHELHAKGKLEEAQKALDEAQAKYDAALADRDNAADRLYAAEHGVEVGA